MTFIRERELISSGCSSERLRQVAAAAAAAGECDRFGLHVFLLLQVCV